MLRILRQLTTSNANNIATHIIYGIIKENDTSIYCYDYLLRDLSSNIRDCIDIKRYNNLTSTDKMTFRGLLISALENLAKASLNTFDNDWGDVTDLDKGNGLQINHRSLNTNSWESGPTSYEDTLKFPDLFYAGVREEIKNAIFSGIEKTKFNDLFIMKNKVISSSDTNTQVNAEQKSSQSTPLVQQTLNQSIIVAPTMEQPPSYESIFGNTNVYPNLNSLFPNASAPVLNPESVSQNGVSPKKGSSNSN